MILRINQHWIKVICTYTLLESCSQGTFLLEQLRDYLSIPGRETLVTIKTINGEFKSLLIEIDKLQVSGVNDDKNQWVHLPPTFTINEIPVDNDGINKRGQLRQWKCLEPVVNQLNIKENISVGRHCVKSV